MKNSAELGESVQMTQQQIGFQPPEQFQQPPPYSVDNIVYNTDNSSVPVYPNWAPNNASVSSGSALNLFNQTLGSNERFILSPIGRFGCMTRTIIVQIRDAAQRPLISVMTIPGRNVSSSDNGNSVRIGSVIQMTNSSGQTILTATENGQVYDKVLNVFTKVK